MRRSTQAMVLLACFAAVSCSEGDRSAPTQAKSATKGKSDKPKGPFEKMVDATMGGGSDDLSAHILAINTSLKSLYADCLKDPSKLVNINAAELERFLALMQVTEVEDRGQLNDVDLNRAREFIELVQFVIAMRENLSQYPGSSIIVSEAGLDLPYIAAEGEDVLCILPPGSPKPTIIKGEFTPPPSFWGEQEPNPTPPKGP